MFKGWHYKCTEFLKKIENTPTEEIRRLTFGVNIHSQNLCLFRDTELFRCALKTIWNFRSPASFDHLSGAD